MKLIYFPLLLMLTLFSAVANATTVAELEKKVAALEALVTQLLEDKKLTAENNNDAEAKRLVSEHIEQPLSSSNNTERLTTNVASEQQLFFYEELSETINKSVKISGYADVEYRGSSEPEVRESFRMHHLSLFFTKNFDNDIKFFSEIEYEDAPKFDGINDGSGQLKEGTGTILVESMNFDWKYSQFFNVRVGRFFTPAGIWSEDHYPPFVSTQERPLHIFKVFPQVVDGVSTFGYVNLGEHGFFDYNLFVGNGESTISGRKDVNSSKAVGFRGNFHFNWLDDFNSGFTLYKDNKDTSNANASKSAYGLHLKARHKALTAQFEYAKTELEFEDPLLDDESDGYYGQLTYNLGNFDLGVRYDVFDKSDFSLDRTTRNSFFINYHLDESITLKGEYHYDVSKNPLIKDFGFYVFSISGFLGR